MQQQISTGRHDFPDFPEGYFALRPGMVAQLKDCPNGYPLPDALSPGERVRILSFDHGYYFVERDGMTFEVNMTNVVG